MKTYAVNQRVEAVVERVYTFGVFARLADGTEAYIRRRELDLDADVDPFHVVHIGKKIQALIINLSERGRLLELSRRATLMDPWPGFLRRVSVGDIIHGEVRTLHPRGVFIRIEAGINGFIPIEEMSPRLVKRPEEVLWVGDEVEAEITRIDQIKKHVHLSVKARLEKYDRAMNVVGYVSSKSVDKSNDLQSGAGTDRQDRGLEDYSTAGPILIVEDDDTVRESLKIWLSQRNIKVTAVSSPYQAINGLPISYRIYMIDLNLQDDDGLQLIRQIKQTGARGHICVMSAPDILAERALEIQETEVAQVFAKPLDMDEILKFLSQAAQNDQLPYWVADMTKSSVDHFAGRFQLAEIHLDAQIQSTLKELLEMLQAEICLLFWLDPVSQTITIQAQAAEGELDLEVIYGLMESPVKDVIISREMIFTDRITPGAGAKFDKLLELVNFESCIGIPLRVFGETHHALFFFHSNKDAFNKNHLREAQTGGVLLSSLLTHKLIQEQVRLLNPMMLSGELSAGFGHDVYNKITALELEASNLINLGNTDKTRPHRILDLVLDLKGTVEAFQELLQNTGKVKFVHINELVERGLRLIRPVARKERSNIVLNLAPDLPAIMGNGIFIQQAFLNIMLNAIQQMTLKAGKYNWNGKRTLEISTAVKDNNLQVRFKDNGPGIHNEHLGRLFTPGFSTRSGSGLGLYIAQSFIQALGGRLIVEETLVPLSTTFLVELPLTQPEDIA